MLQQQHSSSKQDLLKHSTLPYLYRHPPNQRLKGLSHRAKSKTAIATPFDVSNRGSQSAAAAASLSRKLRPLWLSKQEPNVRIPLSDMLATAS